MSNFKVRLIALGMILCAAIGIMANVYASKSSLASEGLSASQDVNSLDRRISSLEQRFFLLEANVNRLQQASMVQRTPPLQSSNRDQEINLLIAELQTVQLRVKEIECGLVKLDERTKTPAVREAPQKDARSLDPCRLNPAMPLRLSTQP